MKTITLTQPWATLVVIGAKRIETRSWRTQYRGPLAIHGAKGFPRWAAEICYEEPFRTVLREAGIGYVSELPRGAVVATCRLVDVLPTEAALCLSGVFDDYPELDTLQEREFGDFHEGRFAWVLEDIKALPEPAPISGALGLWDWTPPNKLVLIGSGPASTDAERPASE